MREAGDLLDTKTRRRKCDRGSQLFMELFLGFKVWQINAIETSAALEKESGKRAMRKREREREAKKSRTR